MRDRIWRGLLIVAVLLGTAAILITAYSRMSDVRQAGVTPQVPAEASNTVNLPMTVASLPAYPYPEPASYVSLQGGSVDLIVGAAMLVLIIIGGILYGQAGME